MHRGSQALGADVHMYDDALGLARDAGVAIGHGEGDHFVGTCYDGGELALLLNLALGDGFDNGGMVGAEIDEAVGHAQFPERLKKGITRGVPGRVSISKNEIILRDALSRILGQRMKHTSLDESRAGSQMLRDMSKGQLIRIEGEEA